MKAKLRKVFFGKESKLKIDYDQTSTTRPAWIAVKKLPKNVQFIYVRIDEGTPAYYVCWYPTIKIFLPIDPTPEEMKKYYNKFSKTYDQFVKQKNINEARELLNKIKYLLPTKAKALDLGAGTGQSTIPFAKKGFDVTLVEISKEMLNIAKKRKELKKCKFICSDVRKLDLKGKCDLIISINAFACIPYFTEREMPSLYHKISKFLKLNGILALSGYDMEPPKKLFKKIESGIYKAGKSRHKYFIGRFKG
jgi:SAM-dependent methyltransferase